MGILDRMTQSASARASISRLPRVSNWTKGAFRRERPSPERALPW